jgi:hypothetical protein
MRRWGSFILSVFFPCPQMAYSLIGDYLFTTADPEEGFKAIFAQLGPFPDQFVVEYPSSSKALKGLSESKRSHRSLRR